MNFSELSVLIGANFRLIRERKGLSQEKVAEELNVATARISEFENGKANPTLNTISNYANSIGVSILDLFDFEELRNNNDIVKKEVLINIHCSALKKRNLKEIQHIFNTTNAFLDFMDQQ